MGSVGPGESTIPAATLAAYRETGYRVGADPPFVLVVGTYSEALALVHRARGVDCSAFLTADNPASRALGAAANARRRDALRGLLDARGYAFIDGVGQHPANGWPGEASFLVLGLGLDDARTLGERFGQNAIVWSAADAVPRLVLLR